jgi:guanine deaminase
MPGLVDTHVHLPQVPAAGLGAGMDLLAWLERYVFPLERDFDVPTAEALAPQVYRAMAAAGTTTFAGYGAIWADSLDACFRAAETHGIRATLGKVMMDRLSYDERLAPAMRLETSLRQSAELCERWHGAAEGRLRYAFTPRFAVCCSADLLRESAALADHYGAFWQTHVSEDSREIATVAALFPEARDYLDVYDRAGGLGPRALLAHAIHLSAREVGRLVDTGSAVAHCPVSNMFIRSGVMPLARYRAADIRVGLGTDVAGAPELSVITQMREGFYQQNSRPSLDPQSPPPPGLFDWLRLGTLGGA